MTYGPLKLEPAKIGKREARLTTILLIARLSTETRDDLCRVRNLSSGGMRIETLSPKSIGERARVELKNGTIVEGEIVWATYPEIGLRFDHPVDTAALLALPGRTGAAPAPRSLRLSARCPVVVRRDGHILPGTLLDISLGGARLALSGPASIDDIIVVGIPGLESRHAAIRWVGSGFVGLSFCEKVGFDDLSRWLASEQRQKSRASDPLSPTH